MKSVMAGAMILVSGLVAYVLLGLDAYVATGLGPNLLTINAFLFLMGLSGALSLLSPPPRSKRFSVTQPNWRDVNRATPDVINVQSKRRHVS